jgi:hypothetical protein
MRWGDPDECPFKSPLLASPAFLTLLSPLVKNLRLEDVESLITPDQFAAICQLTNLVELHISGSPQDVGDNVCSAF